jgi:hypothetical protein
MFRIFLLSAFVVSLLTVTSPANGHTVFKKELTKKYSKSRVSCELCHVKGKPKDERNEFGELFFQKMKDQNLSKQWEAFGENAEGKTKFEKETMLPAFVKVLDEVKTMKNKEGVAYDSLMAEAKLPGLKVKKPGAKSTEDNEDEDDDDKADKGKESAKKDDKDK